MKPQTPFLGSQLFSFTIIASCKKYNSLLKKGTILSFLAALIFSSCSKKEELRTNSGNKPPIANAGRDIMILLPQDSVTIDGSALNNTIYVAGGRDQPWGPYFNGVWKLEF